MAEIRQPCPADRRWHGHLNTKALIDRASVAVFLALWLVAIARFGPLLLRAERWPETGAGLLGGYLLADLLAGSVHWLADRFFGPTTPILGPMLIAPFREHHDDALGITRHDFFEVSGNNALVTIPVVAALAALPQPEGGAMHFGIVFGLSLTLSLFATNQFHSWAHAPAPPKLVRRLHSLGLILTPRRHARHHRGAHDRAYCVTSGWLNPLLDRADFFGRIERFVHAIRPAIRPATSKRRNDE